MITIITMCVDCQLPSVSVYFMYIKYFFIVAELQNKNMLYEVVKLYALYPFNFRLCNQTND